MYDQSGAPKRFHDREVVAPLKRLQPDGLVEELAGFHDREVVAPLKPVRGHDPRGDPTGIPRPRGRGPIEA